MHKIISLVICLNLCVLASGQTKEQTISYLNSLLSIHTNNPKYSILGTNNNTLTALNKYFNKGDVPPDRFYYRINGADAQFISTTLNERGEAAILIAFKPISVKLFYELDGQMIHRIDEINFDSLIKMTKSDLEKLVKGFKYLVQLYGGILKEDLF